MYFYKLHDILKIEYKIKSNFYPFAENYLLWRSADENEMNTQNDIHQVYRS